MRTTIFILIAVCVFAMPVVCGCDAGGTRKESAAVRWEKTMDQVRVEAARESLAQGRYAYARRVLEPCVNDAHRERCGQRFHRRNERLQRDVEQMMVRIQAADQMYAQLDSYRQESEKEERAY